MEYIKINSLWKREQYVKGLPKGTHGPLIIGDYSDPEVGNVKKWLVDEKVDGTNIRVIYSDGKVRFSGRTDEAQLPVKLLDYLQQTLGEWSLVKAFPTIESQKYPTVILFGEGYGPKIQACGGNYRKDVSFILFDVWVDGWWLERSSVKDIASKLGIEVVPEIGIMTEEEIIEFVRSKPLSRCSITPQVMEGIVARSDPLMLFRNGKPLIWKLKCKEFKDEGL